MGIKIVGFGEQKVEISSRAAIRGEVRVGSIGILSLGRAYGINGAPRDCSTVDAVQRAVSTAVEKLGVVCRGGEKSQLHVVRNVGLVLTPKGTRLQGAKLRQP